MKDVNYLKDRFNSMKSKKMIQRDKYEEINRFVRQDGPLFEESEEFEDDNTIYESTAPNAARKAASVLKGILWPEASKSLKLNLIESIPDTEDNKNWIESSTKKMIRAMDNPRAGLSSAIEENFYEQVTFGSAAIFIAEDDETDVRYNSWPFKNIVFDEGKNGVVNTVYFWDNWSVKRIVETYGKDNVSDEIKEAYDKNRVNEVFKIIQAIEPKLKNGKEIEERDSIHFEYESGNILKESKFNEDPVPTVRFFKNTDSPYGISPAIECRPAIKEINRKVQLREYLEEQEITPALGYITSSFGGEYLDITPGADPNPFNDTLSSGTPVFRIIPQVNLNISDDSIVRLEEKITEAFSLDRLLDFNNQTQMTLGEAQIRNQIRGQVNNSIFSRQVAELFTPLIERTFNILFRKGVFGVLEGSEEEALLKRQGKVINYIPKDVADVIKSGEDFYEIEYNTPAARMRDAEALNGIVSSVGYFLQLAQAKPEVLLWLDEEQIAKNVIELTGSPKEILHSKELVEQIKQAQAEAAAKQAQQLEASNDLTLQKQQQEVQSA